MHKRTHGDADAEAAPIRPEGDVPAGWRCVYSFRDDAAGGEGGVSPPAQLLVYDTELPLDEEALLPLWDAELVRRPPGIAYGRAYEMPRSVQFFSNKSHGYSYGGQESTPKPLDDTMCRVLDMLNALTQPLVPAGTPLFNGLLFNRYEPEDSIAPHYDKGHHPRGVASLTLMGAPGERRDEPHLVTTRRFCLCTHDSAKTLFELPTEHRQLMLMHGSSFQALRRHSVKPAPKGRPALTRLNITARCHYNTKSH